MSHTILSYFYIMTLSFLSFLHFLFKYYPRISASHSNTTLDYCLKQPLFHIACGVKRPSTSHCYLLLYLSPIMEKETYPYDSPQSSIIEENLSPALSASDSVMNITPCTSPTSDDELVLFSDSDAGSQSFLADIRQSQTASPKLSSSSSSSPISSQILNPNASLVPSTRKHRTKSRSSRQDTTESTPSPHPKRRLRRKSTKSETSERSNRSSLRQRLGSPDFPISAGYTVTPATGKIFRNLLILEESLREQVSQQKALRRKYLTFLTVLCSLMASTFHHLFLVHPDSISGAFRVVLQFVLFALVMTLILYHLSGEYQKTIVVPRKFLSSTNKGLRQLNVRLVKIKSPLFDNLAELIREFLLFFVTMCLNCLHKVYPSMIRNKNSKLEVFLVRCQLQCQPRTGIIDVKLALNARVFGTDIREGWELYRSEFWIEEGVRRRSAMLSFIKDDESIKREKKERKEKRKKSEKLTEKLSELNLQKLNSQGSLTSTPSPEQVP